VQSVVARRARLGSTVVLQLAPGGSAVALILGTCLAGCHAALIASDAPASTLDQARRDLNPCLELGPDLPDAVGGLPTAAATERGGVLLLSSGTTGRSRFILRRSATLDLIAQGLVEHDLPRADDVVISFLPVHHAFGFEHALLAPLVAGATVEHQREFSPEATEQAVARGGTILPLPPAALARLVTAPAAWSPLRRIIVAGSVLAPSLRARWQASSSVPLTDLYGATELGTIWLDHGRGGVPVPGVEVRVVERSACDAAAIDAVDGCEGSIMVRSSTVCAGVMDHGRLEACTLDGGWFPTGDLGIRRSDRTMRISGRSKLVFDVGGLKVNPIDIESELVAHPRVAAALALPLWMDGEVCRVEARIEPAEEGAPPVPDELRVFLAERLPAHAVPRRIEVVHRLERTASGKIVRPAVATDEPLAERPPVVDRPTHLGRRIYREQWTRELFDSTSSGYDRSSGAAFLGVGRWYRRRMLRRTGLAPGMSMLDIGSGTGLCAWLGQGIVGHQGRVVALDPSPGMLEQARRRGVKECVVGFAESVPFERESFDLVTMSYMLRHVQDLAIAFAEVHRVLRPGGRLLVFEVTSPSSRLRRVAFRHIMRTVVPAIGVMASLKPSTFPMMRYWGDTIDAAVRPEAIEMALAGSGLKGVRHVRELGVFSCYRGVRAP
jgi:demethylmenaquinone methyltransferase/2-methoxy-6-polyprenyl-1,4-benzoquinol methylase